MKFGYKIALAFATAAAAPVVEMPAGHSMRRMVKKPTSNVIPAAFSFMMGIQLARCNARTMALLDTIVQPGACVKSAAIAMSILARRAQRYRQHQYPHRHPRLK